MRARLRASVGALTLAVTACTGRSRAPSSEPVADIAEGFGASVRRDVQLLRNATSKFHDLSAAKAAGYPTEMPRCIADSTMGAMGHHLIDRTLFDEKLEIERPEMLIYAPAGEGEFALVAVEYVVPYRVRPPTETPPRLFGQELRRYDHFNFWALHVWAWRRNPAGLFADWNPSLKC